VAELDKEQTLNFLRRFAQIRRDAGAYDEYRAVTVVADELAGGLYDARDWN
jgi:hypothetical protein